MKKILIGCGGSCLGVLILAAIVAAVYGPKIFSWSQTFVTNQIEEEMTRQKLANQWEAPKAESEVEVWLPESLESFQRKSLEENAEMLHLQTDAPFRSAQYASSKGTATVFWLSADEFDYTKITSELRQASEEGSYKTWLQMGFRAYVSWNSPSHQYNVWNLKDWILMVHSSDPDFDTDALIQQILVSQQPDSPDPRPTAPAGVP